MIQTKSAKIQQWNEAGFKKGKSLQKLNRQDDAISTYLDLLNGRLNESSTEEVPEYLWRIKGGLEAADMKQTVVSLRSAYEG
ncbi:MAG: hypothetical protein V4507_13375, partial [Verrucomicrobiota bacterium]